MAKQKAKVADEKFVVVPEREYARLKREAERSRGGRRPHHSGSTLPAVEIYDDRRIAEFLLSNSVDSEDYAQARHAVRRMGLEPDTIRHYKPDMKA
jgi:hypothetical protein